MEEVPIEFRTYYRVELAGSTVDAAASAQSPSPSPEPADGDAAETAPQDPLDPMPVEVGAARGKRFGRN
jgi:hypothetical protein